MNGAVRILVAMLAVATLSSVAAAQPMPISREQTDAIRQNAEQLGAQARDALQPLPEGQVKVLQAVVMEVQGRAQWRAKADQPYRAAAIDDVLEPGAMIRTGRKATLTLRLGHNATIMIDRQTRVTLPEIVQAGASLRTAVHLIRGRADVKVDRVELTNDFSVVTPSTTLAVRGTGYGVRYGGLRGTEAFAARTNEIRSIEIRYFLSRLAYAMSAGDRTSDTHRHPALAGLFDTFGPPPLVDGLIEADATPAQLVASIGRSPVVDGRKVDQGLSGLETVEQHLPLPPEPEPMPGPDAQLAEFICGHLIDIFATWSFLLTSQELDASGVPAVQMQVEQICASIPPGGFVGGDLDLILAEITLYCSEFNASNFDICVDTFSEAVANPNPPG